METVLYRGHETRFGDGGGGGWWGRWCGGDEQGGDAGYGGDYGDVENDAGDVAQKWVDQLGQLDF